jgi:hypothetical protein
VFSKSTDYELAVLGQDTYDKQQWSAEDIRTLRGCWDEYQRRGEDTITLFRPAYADVFTFHEIDGGEVGVDDVRLLERAGAGIAPDYREVMRKLRGVEVPPYEKPENLPEYEDWEAIEELIRITSADEVIEPIDR